MRKNQTTRNRRSFPVKTIRPFTVCAVVKGIIFTDQRIREIVRLQEKLVGTLGRNAKIRNRSLPITGNRIPNKIYYNEKEEIQYVPLGYDKEMTAEEILTIHKKGKEHGHILKDAKKYPCFP